MTRPLTVTAVGNAQLSASQSKFGGSSVLLDGTGDYLNINSTSELAFGTGDFCMETWLYKTGGTSYHTIFDMRTSGSDGGGIILGINNVNQIYMYYNFGYRVTTAAISNDTWTHIALARVNGVTRVFINGTQSGSSYTDTNNYAQRGIHIGADPLGNYAFPGYMDEIRISQGNGRYSTAFTPSTTRFWNDNSTSVLIHGDSVYGISDDAYDQTDSDQLYIVDGYFDGDDYFVYTAEAVVAQACTASITAAVGVIKQADSALTVTCSVTATISHIEGADLFAFSEAQIAIQVSVLRDNNSAMSSNFSVAVDAVRGIYVSAQADAVASFSVGNSRVRNDQAAIDAAFSLALDITKIVHASADDFAVSTVLVGNNTRVRYFDSSVDCTSSLTADVSMVPGGEVVEASGTWSSQFDIDAKGTKKHNIIDCDVTAVADLTANANRFRGVDSLLEVNASLTAIGSRARDIDLVALGFADLTAELNTIKEYAANLQADSAVSVDNIRVRFVASDISSEFAQTTAINLTTTLAAGLTSSASISIDNSRVRNDSADLTASSTLDATANRFRGIEANVTSQADLSTNTGFLKSGSIDCSALFTPSIACNAITNTFAVLDAVASVSADVDAIRTLASAITSSTSLTALASITKQGSAAFSVEATIADSTKGNSDILGIIKQAFAKIPAVSSLSAVGTFYGKRPRYAQAVSSGVVVSTAQSVLGGASLYVPYNASGGTGISYQRSNDYIYASNQDFNIELFVRFTSFSGSSSKNIIGTLIDNSYGWSIELNSTNRLQFRTAGGVVFSLITASALTTGVWYYIRVMRNSGTVYLETATKTGDTWSSITLHESEYAPYQIGSTSYPSQLQMGYELVGGYFDEVYIAKGSATRQQFQVGTTPNKITEGAASTTLALFHYDTDFTDDMTGIQQASAALSAQASQTASGQRIRFGVANLSAQATVTADVRKYGNVTAEAALSSTTAVSVIGNGTVRVDANLASEGFLLAAVGRIVPETAALDVTSSLTVDLNRQYNAQADLTATASLSVSALDLDIASAALTATASLTATALRKRNATSAISATASLSVAVDQVILQLLYGVGNTSGYITSPGTTIRTDVSWANDTWPDSPYAGFRPVQSDFFIKLDTDIVDGQSIDIYTSSSGTHTIKLLKDSNWVYSGGVKYLWHIELRTTVLVGGGLYGLNTVRRTYIQSIPLTDFNPLVWNNIQMPLNLGFIGYPGNTSTHFQQLTVYGTNVYVNGQSNPSLISFTNEIDIASGYSYPTQYLNQSDGGQWGSNTNPVTVFLDQIWIRTASYNTTEDIVETQFPPSDFYSASTTWGVISSTGQTTTGLQAQVWLPFQDLNDRSSVTPTWDYTRHNSVVTGLTFYGSAAVTSSSQLAINPVWLRRANSTQQVTAALTANNRRVRYASSAVSTTASVTAAIDNRLREIPAALTASTSLTVSADKIKNATVSLTASATQVTNARKTVVTGSTQQVTASLTSTVLRIKQIDSTFSAIATELVAAAKNATGTVLMESVSTVSAVVRKVTDEPQALTATSQLTCTGVNTQFGSANLTSTFTESSQEIYLRRVEVNLSTQAELTCQVSKFVGVDSSQSAETELTAASENSRIRFAQSNLTVSTSQACDNMIVRLAQANLTTQASLEVFAGILVRVEADLLVNAFTLTAGKVINIDLYYQLTIQPERRTLLVLPESRQLTVDSETRVNIIKGYTL